MLHDAAVAAELPPGPDVSEQPNPVAVAIHTRAVAISAQRLLDKVPSNELRACEQAMYDRAYGSVTGVVAV